MSLNFYTHLFHLQDSLPPHGDDSNTPDPIAKLSVCLVENYTTGAQPSVVLDVPQMQGCLDSRSRREERAKKAVIDAGGSYLDVKHDFTWVRNEDPLKVSKIVLQFADQLDCISRQLREVADKLPAISDCQ